MVLANILALLINTFRCGTWMIVLGLWGSIRGRQTFVEAKWFVVYWIVRRVSHRCYSNFGRIHCIRTSVNRISFEKLWFAWWTHCVLIWAHSEFPRSPLIDWGDIRQRKQLRYVILNEMLTKYIYLCCPLSSLQHMGSCVFNWPIQI